MRVFVTASLLALALSAIAQQDQFQWRIAAHAGIDRSLSDIESSYSDVNWERSRTLGLELSKSLGYGVSLGLGVERTQLSGYDVLTGRQDRALNFKSELNTAQLELLKNSIEEYEETRKEIFIPLLETNFILRQWILKNY